MVLLISCGLFMFTFESTQFNLEGFILVLLASFVGGIRWTFTQVLMQKAELGQCWFLLVVKVKLMLLEISGTRVIISTKLQVLSELQNFYLHTFSCQTMILCI